MGDGISDGYEYNSGASLTGKSPRQQVNEKAPIPEIPESEFTTQELYVAALEKIAALTAEVDALKAEIEELKKSKGCIY